MKIIEALKNDEHNLRISYGNRWLEWSEYHSLWVVYERKRDPHSTPIVIATDDEEKAVAALLGEIP